MIAVPSELLVRAVIGAVLVGISASLTGTFVVQMDLSSIGFCMSHAAFAGAALGLLLEISPILSAVAFALIVSFLLGPVSKKAKLTPGVVTGIAFSVTIALGFVFLNLQPGAAATGAALSILWGSVFALGWMEVFLLGILTGSIIIVILTFKKELMTMLFDRKMAEASGVRTDPFFFLILSLTGMVVAFSLKLVGGLLVFALIVNTASVARQFFYDINKVLIFSPIVGAVCCLLGFSFSMQFNFPVGASIVIFTALAFGLSVAVSPKRGSGGGPI